MPQQERTLDKPAAAVCSVTPTQKEPESVVSLSDEPVRSDSGVKSRLRVPRNNTKFRSLEASLDEWASANSPDAELFLVEEETLTAGSSELLTTLDPAEHETPVEQLLQSGEQLQIERAYTQNLVPEAQHFAYKELIKRSTEADVSQGRGNIRKLSWFSRYKRQFQWGLDYSYVPVKVMEKV